MSSPTSPPVHLDREFLPVRAKILEIAAALDRIQRDAEDYTDDPRWQQLQAGIRLIDSDETARAEQVQLLFSCPYDHNWRESLDLSR